VSGFQNFYDLLKKSVVSWIYEQVNSAHRERSCMEWLMTAVPVRLLVPGALFCLSVGAFPKPAYADEGEAFELAWEAPSECPTARRIRDDVERLIGSGSHEGGVKHVSVQVTGDEANGYRVRLRFDEQKGESERILRGPTCNQVSRAAALLIALAIEPNADISQEPEPEPEPPKPEPKLEPPKPQPKPVVVAQAPRERDYRWVLAVGPAVEAGLLPALSPGLDLSLGLRIGVFEPELYASGFLPRSKDIDNSSAGGQFTLFTAGARACFRMLDSKLEIFGCAGAALNHLSAEGYKVSVPGSADTNVGSVDVALRLQVPLSRRVALRLTGGPVYSLGRAEFVVEGLAPVHEAKRVSGAGSLKLALSF
jgi:hypothetical protein